MIPRLLGRATAHAGRASARLSRALAHLDRRHAITVVGGASLALGLGVVFLPWLFPAATFRPASRAVGTPAVVAVFGAAAALLAASALRESATDAGDAASRATAWLPDRSPEQAHYDEVRTAGLVVDRALDFDPNDADDPVARRRDARNRIREVAVAAIAAAENCERVRAIERIDDGSWTDDPRAAAFLGGRALAPLGVRIRDWASGERFDRWATRAVAEIEALAGTGARRDAVARADADAEPRADTEARADAETRTDAENRAERSESIVREGPR